MDRHIWTQKLTAHYCPPWPCNTCGKGTLVLAKDSLVFKETVESVRSRKYGEFDVDSVPTLLQLGHNVYIHRVSRSSP